MATNLPSCFSIQCLEQLLKSLVNFTLLKYVKSQRSSGFLITKELIFGFQIFYLIDHFSASLKDRVKKVVFAYCSVRLAVKSFLILFYILTDHFVVGDYTVN